MHIIKQFERTQINIDYKLKQEEENFHNNKNILFMGFKGFGTTIV